MKANYQTAIKEGILVITPENSMLEEMHNGQMVEVFKKSVKDGNKEIIINLKEVKNLNSAGLNQLLLCAAKLSEVGGELVLCNLSEQNKKLVRISSLEHVFNEMPDEESAIHYSRIVKTRFGLLLLI